MAIAITLIRGFMRAKTDRVGNFWVDLIRGTVQASTKSEPASADEDLKVTATISGSAYYADVTLTA